ncbi:unnamed protein product [Alternaria alternata]
MANVLRVAACHVSPIFLNARRTTDKAISLIKQAGSNKANLVVFPETYISAFPIWSALRAPTENHTLFQRMVQESIYADSDEMEALVPTFFEKLTWSSGDGHGLRVADTQFGRIGTLICGENTNALARYSFIAQAEQVHISTWPAIWPTRTSHTAQSTDDSDEQSSPSVARGTNYDNLAANKTRAAAHCFEAKCFGVACSGHLAEDAIKTIIDGASQPDVLADTLRAMPRAATFFLDPTGAPLRSFTYRDAEKEYVHALQDQEGILYADMNLDDCIEGKQYHDVVGGYQRLDVFDLKVDRSRKEPVRFS